MPVRMKQLILFLSILLFYPLLFWLTLYYVHDVPIHGTPDPSGGAKVGRAIEAVLGAFLITVIFLIVCHLWAKKVAIHAGLAWLANIFSIVLAFVVFNALGFYL